MNVKVVQLGYYFVSFVKIMYVARSIAMRMGGSSYPKLTLLIPMKIKGLSL